MIDASGVDPVERRKNLSRLRDYFSHTNTFTFIRWNILKRLFKKKKKKQRYYQPMTFFNN